MLWAKLYDHWKKSFKRANFYKTCVLFLEQIVLLKLSYRCIVTINVLWLFLTVPWVGLQCVILVFPDHIHLCFALI